MPANADCFFSGVYKLVTATERSQHDEEYRQACARVVLSCVALAVCLSVWFWHAGGTTARPLSTAAVAAVYGVFSAAWAALVKRYRGVFVARRLIIVCTDLAVTAFATYMLGPLGGGFYPIYLWIVVGNGMRFGPRYLYAATAAAGVSFGAVLLCTAHWQQQLPVGLSLLIGICVLPLFYAICSQAAGSANGRAVPPRETLVRHSAPGTVRSMAPITRPPTTNARMSRPSWSSARCT